MNYSQFFAIEKRLKNSGLDVDRSELISDFTSNKKHSLKSLSDFEYAEFIRYLNSILKNLEPRIITVKIGFSLPNKDDEKTNQMRRKIIALFCQMGYLKEGKADMTRIYDWVLKSGYLKKPLNQYTSYEMPKLVFQAEAVYASFIKRI